MNPRGRFITLEGPEGSGKSSQGRRLVQALRRAGYRVVFVRDPGSTSLGRALRRVLLHTRGQLTPLIEALLFIGGRVALVEERIQPALRQGKIVVCDRFHDATVVYQGFAGGLNVPWLDALGCRAIHHTLPALTIVLDVPVSQGFARIHRSHDRMESKARTFHEQVRRGYRQWAKQNAQRVAVVDASRSPERVWGDMRAVIHRRLKVSVE